ncbi:MAG: glycosyltransferase family 2 protein, partial [Promethearchaeota archaeon]
MKEKDKSKKFFFKDLFILPQFRDRKLLKNEDGIDVIVPIINTNELFESNLYSWYRSIPINRLLIGYGGGTDNSLEIVKKFPRVKIIDQTKYKDHLYGSQGKCIADLISLVETDWFIYLHSDVYLPEDWYDIMKSYQNKYDWFECARENVVLIKYEEKVEKSVRAYSGSQMGRKEAFKNIIPKIEDGYLQNNEDIIFHEMILQEGYKYGKVLETKHYHQIMNKGEKEPDYQYVFIKKKTDKNWEKKIYTVQAKGIIKYCKPKK